MDEAEGRRQTTAVEEMGDGGGVEVETVEVEVEMAEVELLESG